jgi:tetratricopeptide (TPR) repeat protein
MLRRSLIAGSLALLVLPLAAQQQDNSAPPPAQNPPAQTNPPAPPKKDQPKKSTSDQNPFPAAQSEAATHQAQQQDNSEPSVPQPQATPQNGAPAKPASDNPFPEAESQKAAREAQHPDDAPPPVDDQNFSSSQVKGLDMPTTDETPPANLPPSSMAYNPKLARKDAEVGDYYMESGNWQGAYERFLEANRSDAGNAEAVWGLAETARHLHHPDEALRNYRLYLSALPNGPHAKEIRKVLKEMGAAPPA